MTDKTTTKSDTTANEVNCIALSNANSKSQNILYNEVEHHLIRSIALLDIGMTKFQTANLSKIDSEHTRNAVVALMAIKEVANFYINNLTQKPK